MKVKSERFLSALLVIVTSAAVAQNKNDAHISLSDRLYVASKVYATLRTYFDHWLEVPELNFDAAYRQYLSNVTQLEDRRKFDLETIRFVASLKNGHTWFDDRWLEETDGMPVGFSARLIDTLWVVIESDVPGLRPGDVIQEIDDRSIEDAFQQARPFLASSSERDQRSYFFHSAYLFPKQFSLKLRTGQRVRIDRTQRTKRINPTPVSGRWLEVDSIAYLKITSFDGVSQEAKAIDYVRQFKAAKTLIVDLRGNGGGRGDPPRDLQLMLTDKPVPGWEEFTSARISHLGSAHENDAELYLGTQWLRPERRTDAGIFKGKLIFIIDRGCASYCEDFVMPFKQSGRAILVGETTAGTYSQTYFLSFDNGMMLNTATTRELFPGGSRFEGIGIAPAIQITPTVENIRNNEDVAFGKALQIARQQ